MSDVCGIWQNAAENVMLQEINSRHAAPYTSSIEIETYRHQCASTINALSNIVTSMASAALKL